MDKIIKVEVGRYEKRTFIVKAYDEKDATDKVGIFLLRPAGTECVTEMDRTVEEFKIILTHELT